VRAGYRVRWQGRLPDMGTEAIAEGLKRETTSPS
jgi:hypothetical protein